MDLKLSGKTALITGASKGIGAGVAQGLAEEGCHVHIVSRTIADLEGADDVRLTHVAEAIRYRSSSLTAEATSSFTRAR